MVEGIRQLANDMMKSIELNALVNVNMYADDAGALVKQLQETRDKGIQEMGISEEELIEMNAIPRTLFMPVSVCGTVSNVLCSIFFNTEKFGYRFSYENRAKEPGFFDSLMLLGTALNKRSRDKSHILRINNDTHSYILYLPPSDDDAYLMQGNAAECMNQFTLQEWMNSKKSGRKLSLSEHCELLGDIAAMKEVPAGNLQRALVDFFSIDDDYKKKYNAFRPTGLNCVFRSFDEDEAKTNLLALYKRTGTLKPPAWAAQK